jgi:hypothetical protein
MRTEAVKLSFAMPGLMPGIHVSLLSAGIKT